MDKIKTITELIKVIIWPVTVLFILLLFRNEVKEIIKLIKKINLPGEVSFELEVGKYGRSKSGELLLKFLKPDGVNISIDNQDKLKDWIKSHGIKASISFFIYNPELFGDAQLKAVKDLNLT